MYFLPNWDSELINEINMINGQKFYLSSTPMASHGPVKGSIQHIQFDCGNCYENFNENKLLKNFNTFNFQDLQGSHWAPHLVPRDLWDEVGGLVKNLIRICI